MYNHIDHNYSVQHVAAGFAVLRGFWFLAGITNRPASILRGYFPRQNVCPCYWYGTW